MGILGVQVVLIETIFLTSLTVLPDCLPLHVLDPLQDYGVLIEEGPDAGVTLR